METFTLTPEIRLNVMQWMDQSGLLAVLRFEHPEAWLDTWGRLLSQPVGYAASMIDYQHAYMRSSGESVADISLILLNDGKPCAVWPLTLTIGDSSRLSSLGTPVLPPLFDSNLSSRTIKKITASALRFVVNVQKALSQNVIESQEYIAPHAISAGLSEWHQQWLSIGATVNVKHDLYVDLTLPLDVIFANFRKSYRPLISAGLKAWESEVMDENCTNATTWTEFKSLHKQVAGRITRSDETWKLQFDMIVRGEAILLTLRDTLSENRLVGASFFQVTRDEGLYAVAVYDRELFDKPIGHVLQKRAIEIMKQRGLRWYRLGERLFLSDSPKPSEKELSISLFKQGFASYLSSRFMFGLSIDDGLPERLTI